MVTSGTASMQRASSFRELCVFPSLRAATDMAGPGGSAAVERYSRPAAQCGSAQHRRSQGRRPGTPVRPRLYGRAELPTAKSARRGPSRRGPPSRASPVPPRNPDLAQPRDPPGRTSPATQRLVMLRIAGRDRITKIWTAPLAQHRAAIAVHGRVRGWPSRDLGNCWPLGGSPASSTCGVSPAYLCIAVLN
jgi:hypothetical protein